MPTTPWLKVVDALKAPVGTRLTVKGWLRTRRDSKADGGLCFLAIHDGTCFDAIQAVCKGDLPNFASEIAKLTTHCAVEVDGTIVQNPKGGNEIACDAPHSGAVRVIGWVENPDAYPIQPKPHSMEFLRENAHLRARTNTFGAVARIRHCLSMAIHRFYHERGFYYIHTPIITASDAEGAGQMFRVSTLDLMNLPRHEGAQARSHEAKAHAPVAAGSPSVPSSLRASVPVDYSHDFFGREAHLTVSGQLNVETYCMALSRVYTFGPTFRAENSNTTRHLAEFWMIEPEIAFANLHDDSVLAEDFIKYLINACLTERSDDMKFFDERIEKGLLARLKHVLDTPFRRLPYTEAIAILEKAIKGGKKFEYKVQWGVDLQSEHERYLTEEHFKQPVILMNYPKAIKAFYMRENPAGTDSAPTDNSSHGLTVAAMDVLVPGVGEIIGGSQREERLDKLDARIAEMGLPVKEYWWYRDLRRYGTVPHAGFGLGFERAMMFITGMQNVRDVIPFPRTPKSAEF